LKNSVASSPCSVWPVLLGAGRYGDAYGVAYESGVTGRPERAAGGDTRCAGNGKPEAADVTVEFDVMRA
jgi:hypothetical protein